MANPRNIVRYDDIAPEYVTYKHDSTIVYDATKKGGSAQVDLAVTLAGNDQAGLVGDGEFVLGRLDRVESDGFCSVQVGGYMELPGGAGATLTRGTGIVGDLGAASAEGYIRSVASATAAELAVARGFIQNVADATKVLVKLP